MKKSLLAVLFSFSLITPIFADGTNTIDLSNQKNKVSYAIGINVGQQWKRMEIDVDTTAFIQGLHDAGAGTPLLTDNDVKQILTDFQHSMQEKQTKKRAELGIKNKAEGEAFLATNKTNAGVITMDNGLQYQVITTGTGPVPTAHDIVKVNYRGTFLDGTEFDSSYKRGQPAQFPVPGVIKGWTAALEQMNVGSKWKLFVPAVLAYGETGNRAVPPNSVLIFDVELLSTETPPPVNNMIPNPPLTSDIIKVPSAADMKNGAKIETIKPGDVQKIQNQN